MESVPGRYRPAEATWAVGETYAWWVGLWLHARAIAAPHSAPEPGYPTSRFEQTTLVCGHLQERLGLNRCTKPWTRRAERCSMESGVDAQKSAVHGFAMAAMPTTGSDPRVRSMGSVSASASAMGPVSIEHSDTAAHGGRAVCGWCSWTARTSPQGWRDVENPLHACGKLARRQSLRAD